MSIEIGDYVFEGPYDSTDSLKDNSGVYAILDKRTDGNFYVVDIGESAQVKTRIEGHDRVGCWKKQAKGALYVAVHYTPNKQQSGRKEIEQKLRDQFNPPCGDR